MHSFADSVNKMSQLTLSRSNPLEGCSVSFPDLISQHYWYLNGKLSSGISEQCVIKVNMSERTPYHVIYILFHGGGRGKIPSILITMEKL